MLIIISIFKLILKYKPFLDALQIPGLNVEIIWTISAGVKIPEIVATL